MEGTVTGPILLILAMILFAPDYIPLLSSALGTISKAIGEAWKSGIVNTPLSLPPESPNGQYCVLITTLAGVKTHKCYSTTAYRDTARRQLEQQSLGLYTTTNYDQMGGTTQYCVKADGFGGLPLDVCFTNVDDRERWINIGLATHRIANPVRYDSVVPGSGDSSTTSTYFPHGH
jgi:hypothetical protein